MRQPKGPTTQPSVTLLQGNWKHCVRENLKQYRPVISLLHYTCEGNSELEIPQLLNADIDSIFQGVAKQEKGCRVLLKTIQSKDINGLIDLPKRRLLSKAYPFFSAAVRHRGSVKSLDKNFSMIVCSLCHAACRQSPWTSFGFPSAK